MWKVYSNSWKSFNSNKLIPWHFNTTAVLMFALQMTIHALCLCCFFTWIVIVNKVNWMHWCMHAQRNKSIWRRCLKIWNSIWHQNTAQHLDYQIKGYHKLCNRRHGKYYNKEEKCGFKVKNTWKNSVEENADCNIVAKMTWWWLILYFKSANAIN